MSVYTGPVDPPTTVGYPMRRVTSVRYTALGPIAMQESVDENLPDGWTRNMYGELVTTYGDTLYKIQDGKVYKYGGLPISVGTGGIGAAVGSGWASAEADPWEEVPKDQVPVDNQFARLFKNDKLSLKQAEANAPDQGGFGTTSPGTAPGWENRPASMGGPPNPEGWLGSEMLAEQGRSPAFIATYSVPEATDPGRESLPGLGKKQPYEGTYYQRYAIQRAVSKGYGRPQYTPKDVGALVRLPTQELINYQVAFKRIGLPGSESIVLGAPNDPATMSAFTYAMTQANMMGIPLADAIDRLGSIAQTAARTLDSSGYPSAREKFDPVKVRTSVNLTGKARARAQLRSMMSQMLGRMPTNGEVEAYLSKLNAAEKADPTVTTYRYQRDGDVSTTVEQTDVDAALIAERRVKNENPAEYRAMQQVNYFNALLDMLGGE